MPRLRAIRKRREFARGYIVIRRAPAISCAWAAAFIAALVALSGVAKVGEDVFNGIIDTEQRQHVGAQHSDPSPSAIVGVCEHATVSEAKAPREN
jgi:hypothetical protein